MNSKTLTRAGVLIVLLVVAGCGSPRVTKNTAPPPAASQTATFPSTAASPSSSSSEMSGPLGTKFTITTTDDSGNNVSYDVSAVRVLDPAHGTDQFSTPDSVKRFVGVKFTITGVVGYSNDDSNIDASIQGSDGQVYTADFNAISAGTNFNGGNFSVNAGSTQTGWVTFQLPHGVSVTSVQWQPGFGGQAPAVWTP